MPLHEEIANTGTIQFQLATHGYFVKTERISKANSFPNWAAYRFSQEV